MRVDSAISAPKSAARSARPGDGAVCRGGAGVERSPRVRARPPPTTPADAVRTRRAAALRRRRGPRRRRRRGARGAARDPGARRAAGGGDAHARARRRAGARLPAHRAHRARRRPTSPRCATAASSPIPTPRTTSSTSRCATASRVDLEALRRNLFASSSCGVCGKATIDNALAVAPPLDDPARFAPALFAAWPRAWPAAQPVFARTGGLHAAALFAPDGTLLVVREDVGRHNAVDKVDRLGARARPPAARRPRAHGLRPHLVRDRAEGAGGAPARWSPPSRRRPRSPSTSPSGPA